MLDKHVRPKPGKHYYFAKATQADGNLLGRRRFG